MIEGTKSKSHKIGYEKQSLCTYFLDQNKVIPFARFFTIIGHMFIKHCMAHFRTNMTTFHLQVANSSTTSITNQAEITGFRNEGNFVVTITT